MNVNPSRQEKSKTPAATRLSSQLAHLPKQPGVYLFKSTQGDIVYIGKAAVLADRVRSYFQKGADLSPKIRALVAQVADVETIITKSELEALILESNLIKRHRPRFNVVLRDDKQYPYLRLPIHDDFPRFFDKSLNRSRSLRSHCDHVDVERS